MKPFKLFSLLALLMLVCLAKTQVAAAELSVDFQHPAPIKNNKVNLDLKLPRQSMRLFVGKLE